MDSPEMVSTDKTLETSANTREAKVLTQLNRLVHPTIAIAQIGRLRCTKVNSKALFRTDTDHFS